MENELTLTSDENGYYIQKKDLKFPVEVIKVLMIAVPSHYQDVSIGSGSYVNCNPVTNQVRVKNKETAQSINTTKLEYSNMLRVFRHHNKELATYADNKVEERLHAHKVICPEER